MQQGWDDKCAAESGGTSTAPIKTRLPTNSFLLLAVRLQQRSGKDDQREYYRVWAARVWNWFKSSA